ncbi:MAG TPA: site-2 protease family protein [Phycisphaerae bacterium]|nr:site-2 protease family protein [Phycisphaerae bacterium]
MSWRDRDYNRGGSAGAMFDSPLSLINWSLALCRLGEIEIRLHFWLLLTFLFIIMTAVRTGAWTLTGLALSAYLIALLLHEFGHFIFARLVGGSHHDFVIWPFGNMVPPSHPPAPWAAFLANAGGIIANIFAGFLSGLVLFLLHNRDLPLLINPLVILWNPSMFISLQMHHTIDYAVALLLMFYLINLSLFLVNLFPFFWFDGANLLHAILWPFAGRYRALNITCWVGMIVAVPLILLAVYTINFFSLVFFVLLFFSSFSRRRELLADGPAAMEDFSSFSAGDYDSPHTKKKKAAGGWMKWAARKAKKERVDQEKIDRILDKVHEKGLHSLTWLEKRTLRKATQRQKERDVEAHR